MSPLSSIGLHYSFVPLVILIDLPLSTTLLTAFGLGSSWLAFSKIWMSQLSFIELHCYCVPPAILIDPHLLTTLLSALETDSTGGT
jgi:hypothetical protein